jgi:hypothetical protein
MVVVFMFFLDWIERRSIKIPQTDLRLSGNYEVSCWSEAKHLRVEWEFYYPSQRFLFALHKVKASSRMTFSDSPTERIFGI